MKGKAVKELRAEVAIDQRKLKEKEELDIKKVSANKEAAWLNVRSTNVRTDFLILKYNGESPPINVESIIEFLGITLKKVKDPGWSGALTSCHNGEATIWIDDDECETRQRFTMAHELGHLLLHPVGMEFRDTTYKGGKLEQEANQFAADLLMPAWMILNNSGLHKEGVTSAKAISEIFQVSELSARFRMQKLGFRVGK